jgi:hypothetical protein
VKKFTYILLLILLVLPISNQLFAQFKPPQILNDPDYDFEKRLRFGFSLSLHVMDFQTMSNPTQEELLFADVSHLIPGFNVNVVSDLRIVPTLHLRFLPGLAFGQRDLSFYQQDGTFIHTMKMESSFIEMPLALKYAAVRKSNARPYLIAGTNFRIDMAAYKKLNIEEGIYLRLVKGDFYYEYGFGVDFFLTYFKFSTEIKISSGSRNVLARADEQGEVYANAIDRLKSQMVILSFHFE